jgi:hypothetical protein
MAYLAFPAVFNRVAVLISCALVFTTQAAPIERHGLRRHIPAAAARSKPLGAVSETNRMTLAL